MLAVIDAASEILQLGTADALICGVHSAAPVLLELAFRIHQSVAEAASDASSLVAAALLNSFQA